MCVWGTTPWGLRLDSGPPLKKRHPAGARGVVPPPPSSCLPTQVVITLSEEELRQIVDTHYDALFSEIQSERQAAHQSTTSFCLFSWQQGNRPTHLWDV